MKIKIVAKQIGRKSALFENQSIELDIHQHTISVPQFLDAVVDALVRRYQNSSFEKDDDDQTHKPMDDYFSALLNSGKAGFGALYNLNKVDMEKAKTNAIQAFEDGQFALFHGDHQLNADSIISLPTDDAFTFIRLTFLAGSYW